MNSDAENVVPLSERNLLPIRRLSSLIPLRKASRNRYAFQDSNYHLQTHSYTSDALPATNTFHTSESQVWPPKHLRLRTEETPVKQKEKPMAVFSTPQPAPPIRFPISPPPEDELRRSQTSSGSSRKRVRSISKSAMPSPNPKAKKLPKLRATESTTAVDSAADEEDFDNWVVTTKSKKPKSTEKSNSKKDDHRHSRPSSHTPRVDGSQSVSKADRRASTASNKHTPSNKSRRPSSPPPSKSRSRPSAARSQSKTPSRSRASYSFSQSRPVTPSRLHTPPPDINSLPPPAPPSPSDDPLLLAGAPYIPRKKKSAKKAPRVERDDYERRAASPPAQRHYSPALELSGLGETTYDDDQQANFDASLAETSGQWDEPEIPAGTDYLVPLNFGSSITSSSAKKPSSTAGSPYPNTVVGQLEDGTPITRKQHFTMRSPGREASLAMRMAASTSPKQSVVRRSPGVIQLLPDASFGFGGYHDQQELGANYDFEPNQGQQDDLSVSHLVHRPAPKELVEAYSNDEQAQAKEPSEGSLQQTPIKNARSPSSSSPEPQFSHGKRLSERFAELEQKLASEGRSFRFSEIAAVPSSDPAGGFGMGSMKFPDLPSSSVSPEKLYSQASSSPEKSVDQDVEEHNAEQEDLEEKSIRMPEELYQVDAEVYTSDVVSEEPVYVEERPEDSLQAYTEEEATQEEVLQESVMEELSQAEAEVKLERSESPEQSDSEEDLQEVQEEQEAMDSLFDEDSAMQAIHEPVDLQRPLEASFIAPIQRDISSVDDASSVHSSSEEDEEEYETSAKEDLVAINSTFERDLHPVDSTFEQDSVIQQHKEVHEERVEVKARIIAKVVPIPQDEEEKMEEEVEEEEALAGPSWEDETDAEPLVQIRSNDPVAAARAAAILNLHHEYVQGTPKRRDTSSIADSSRRRPATPSVVGARARYSQLLATPSRKGGDISQLVATPTVPRQDVVQRQPPVQEWTKREWRCLEQCFTDVRMEVAQALDTPDIDPEEIDLDDVVGRFVDTYAEGRELEGEWGWDKIHRRSMALINRQKEGLARGLMSVVGSPTQSVFTPVRPSTSTAAPVIRMPSYEQPSEPVSSLQAPQYTHLQHNQVAQSTGYSTPKTNYSTRTYTSAMPPPPTVPVRSSKATTSKSLYPALPPPFKPYQIPSATPLGPTIKSVPEPSSATKRVWSWMGSFLRGGSEAPSETGTHRDREFIPVLPPITDADRDALRPVSPQPPKEKARIVPPKEQVHLQHVPTPQPVRPPPKLNYKTSAGSIKDMIRSFESLSDTLDNSKNQPSKPFVIKKASNGSLSARSFDMWKDVSADVSRDRSISQDISVGSVRSQRSFEGTGFNRGRYRL